MTTHEGEAAPPDIDDIRRAADALSEHLSLPTPLVHSPALSEALDAHVSLKLEFANPIGAFKLRGGVHLAGELAASGETAGLVTASTGNHGQSIAYGAALHGLDAVIFVPEHANPDKLASIRRLGAEVREEGARFDDANAAARDFAAERGLRYVDVDGPSLIAGVATAALEALDPDGGQQPDTDVVIVPLGGGSGACGWVLTRDGVGADCEVWAVQSAQAPAGHDSWRAGRVVERANPRTTAEGLGDGHRLRVHAGHPARPPRRLPARRRRRHRGGGRRAAGARAPPRRARRRGAARGGARRRASACADAAWCWC